MLKWLDAQRATEVGVELADAVVLRVPEDSRPRPANGVDLRRDLQSFLHKFLQHVDRDARPLQLNFFQRAKLANTFKWRLLDKGVERELVEELTQALIVRLNPGKARAAELKVGTAAAGSGDRQARGEGAALLAEANELLARKAYPEAASAYQEALASDPRNAPARVGLAGVFFHQGHLPEAEAELRRALAIRPNYLEAHNNLGVVLQASARYLEAEQSLRRALKLQPGYHDAQLNLAIVLTFLGRLREAQGLLEKLLTLEPRNSSALIALGRIHALEGKFGDAEALFQRALEADPKTPRAWASLAELRKMTGADAAWLKGAEASAASGLAPLEEASLRFAIGKYFDDLGDFERAFRSYQRGNELMKAIASPYDPQARARLVDDLIRAYPPEVLARPAAEASDSRLPVLVTGMPRSGTSLVEQLIASHPDARGAGELDFWSRALHKHPALRSAPPGAALTRSLVAGYLRELGARSSAVQRVVDKATVNSDHLGLIHTVFPNARVIYLQRDPIDTCLSCYFQPFSPALRFTTELAELADYYRQHHRLMAHWRSALPAGTLLDVPYEALVADLETWARRIVDFIGLPWNARCLEFHTTQRPVATASYWQVRQKLFTSSVGRWHHYEKFIGPLLELRGLA